MAKCLNCAKNATYNVKNAGARAQDFCDAHLPKFFNKKNLPAHVTSATDVIVEQIKQAEANVVEEAKVETPKPAKKKAVAEPKVEPVAEAVAEPTPEPTPEAVAEAVAEEAVAE